MQANLNQLPEQQVEVEVVQLEKPQQVEVVEVGAAELVPHHLPVVEVVEVVEVVLPVEILAVQNYQLWGTNNQLADHQKACKLTLETYQNI